MPVIEFKSNYEEYPDFEKMTPEQLKAYRAVLLQQLAELDAKEPKNMNSEAYEEWGDRHEELEDLLDEIQDILDDLDA